MGQEFAKSRKTPKNRPLKIKHLKIENREKLIKS